MGLTVNQTYPVVDILTDVDPDDNIIDLYPDFVDARPVFGIPGALTTTRLHLPDNLSYDDWRRTGLVLRYMEQGVQWWLGDWWRYGQRKYGEMASQESRDAVKDITGYTYQAIADASWVSSRFENSRRRENLSFSHHREVSKFEAEDQDRWLDIAEEKGWSVHELRNQIRNTGEAPQRDSMAIHYSSDSPEWYTPPHIIDRVAKVLERIDLDPCSNSHDDPAVPAVEVYTVDDDGLSQPWHGRVYMNPPYGSEISKWVEKLASEFEAGNVREAIALVPARVDTNWFRRLPATYVCFINGRLTFSGCDNAAPFPSALLYLGPRADRFLYTFEDIGTCFQRLGRT